MATQRNASGEINPVPPAQRMSPQFTSYPNGTALKNATVPIFKIESLQWVENRTTLPENIMKAITFDKSGYLNISREDSMLQQTIVGTSALLKDSPWIPPPSDRLPAPKTFSGTISEVIMEDKTGLCNATDIGRGHGNADMKLLLKFGVPVAKGILARTPTEAREIVEQFGQPCVIKSQILKGGRGKGSFENELTGGIQIVDSPEVAQSLASRMLGQRLRTKQTSGAGVVVEKLYVTETIEYQDEQYLAMTLDRENYTPVIIASREGGVNIEQTTKNNPDSLHSFSFNLDEGIMSKLVSRIGNALQSIAKETDNLRDILTRLHAIFVTKDATSLAINPLAKSSDGIFTCLDSKFTFDDASEKRQLRLFAIREDKAAVKEELECQENGLAYIMMDGNIGSVVNGAGLAMATNDAIAYHRGASANFLDAGGQTTKMMQKHSKSSLETSVHHGFQIMSYKSLFKSESSTFEGKTAYKQRQRGLKSAVRPSDRSDFCTYKLRSQTDDSSQPSKSEKSHSLENPIMEQLFSNKDREHSTIKAPSTPTNGSSDTMTGTSPQSTPDHPALSALRNDYMKAAEALFNHKFHVTSKP
ncbi:hypothetical protein NM208_g10086 [Fusarium decemcellulare]|uniref:Uncharacterized protein n=1 Tax=Fusarium decemcellulare TaxID=57161 RepID=A0ACC1RZ47_9HYPO|nr:hypothetical protein NM208_g10086 [Fusarium decemcellulare]